MSLKEQEQLVNEGFLYKTGCQVTYVNATTVSVAAGQLRDSTNTFDIDFPSPSSTTPKTCGLSSVGAGGLDAGTVAANTLYALYVVSDSEKGVPPELVFSKSLTGPSMPATSSGTTFSAYRLIDYVATDGSSNIRKFYNTPGYGTIYKQYDAPVSVLSGGNATAYTALDLSAVVPSANFGRVKLQSEYVPHAAGEKALVQPTGGTGDAWEALGIVASVTQAEQFDIYPQISADKAKVSYRVTVATSPAAFSLLVVGFEYCV